MINEVLGNEVLNTNNISADIISASEVDLLGLTSIEKDRLIELVNKLKENGDYSLSNIPVNLSLIVAIITIREKRRKDSKNSDIGLIVCSEDLIVTIADLSKKLALSPLIHDASINNKFEVNADLVVGTNTAITSFILSDAGRATFIGNVIFINPTNTNIEETRNCVAESCKRGTRPQLILFSDSEIEQNHELSEVKDLVKSLFRLNNCGNNHFFVSVEEDGESRLEILADTIEAQAIYPAIIFCNHTSEVNAIETKLKASNITCERFFGRPNPNRTRTIKTQIRNGTTKVIIATDVATEELDLDPFLLIVNFSIPSTPEVYLHRTEVIGSSPKVINFVSILDQANFHYVSKIIDADIVEIPVPAPENVVKNLLEQLIKEATQANNKPQIKRELLAIEIARHPEAATVISYLLAKEHKNSHTNSTRVPRERENRDNHNRDRDNSDYTDRRNTQRSERSTDNFHNSRNDSQVNTEKPRTILKEIARLYIGAGESNGLTAETLNSMFTDSLEKVIPTHISIRNSYSFLDVPNVESETVINYLKSKLGEVIKLETKKDLEISKAVTISVREPIKDETEENSNQELNSESNDGNNVTDATL
jgi:superfamily II DNA/RNA helicase